MCDFFNLFYHLNTRGSLTGEFQNQATDDYFNMFRFPANVLHQVMHKQMFGHVCTVLINERKFSFSLCIKCYIK